MAHNLVAILFMDAVDENAAARFDLRPVALACGVTMLPIDHYFTAYWQATVGTSGALDIPPTFPEIYPREAVVLTIARAVGGVAAPRFALIMTEYFGGVGEQWAAVFEGERRSSDDQASINDALRALGVIATPGRDAFDTVRLTAHRGPPNGLERYVALCEALGV